MSNTDFITAFAPATIGNLGVGFDMLGLAIAGAGDRVSARKVDTPGVSIAEVRGIDGEIHPTLSANADENTASIAAKSLWDQHGDGSGIELLVHKGVPLQSGMGSSAASAVAAAVAVNALLDQPLDTIDLLTHALAGEKFASGGLHADNVAPSLIGGLVLCPPVLLPRMIPLSTPQGISSVLVHPDLQVNTADSRNALAKGYSMQQWLTQQGYLGGFIAACAQNDIELLAECLRDELIEPQRAASVPCFAAVKAAAMKSGALGCSLSGSGPSIFALCADGDAANLATAMEQACRKMGYECQSWQSPLDAPGARIEGQLCAT
jgi:homoserine kinase